jgi:hypothetical protein
MQDSDAKQTASGTLVPGGAHIRSPPFFFILLGAKRFFIVPLIGGKEGTIIGCLSPLALLTGKPDHWVATASIKLGNPSLQHNCELSFFFLKGSV